MLSRADKKKVPAVCLQTADDESFSIFFSISLFKNVSVQVIIPRRYLICKKWQADNAPTQSSVCRGMVIMRREMAVVFMFVCVCVCVSVCVCVCVRVVSNQLNLAPGVIGRETQQLTVSLFRPGRWRMVAGRGQRGVDYLNSYSDQKHL